MKKKKNKDNIINVWRLIPNQFEFDMYLCLSNNRPIKELIPIFNQKYGLDFDMKLIDTCKDQNSDCTLFNYQKKLIIIVLNEYTQSAMNYATISHQIFHIITFISDSLNIPIDHEHTTEVWAYFMSFYVNVCIEILNDYLKGEKDEKKVGIKTGDLQSN